MKNWNVLVFILSFLKKIIIQKPFIMQYESLFFKDILAPPTGANGDFAAEWIAYVTGNLNLVVPIITATIVILTVLITICALRRGKTDSMHKGNWSQFFLFLLFFSPSSI